MITKNSRFQLLALPFLLLFCLATSCPAQLATCQYQTYVNYGGGGVMNNPATLHPIFYGDFTTGSFRESLILDYLAHITSSSTFNVIRTYSDNNCNPATNQIAIGSAVNVSYYYGSGYYLAANDITSLIQTLISNSVLSANSDDLYVVYTHGALLNFPSGDPAFHGVFLNGYPTSSVTNWTGSPALIHYAAVGTDAPTFSNVPSPNGDQAADNAAYLTNHEVAEMLTDPNYPNDGWNEYAGTGSGSQGEIADICQGISQTTYPAPNGTSYRIVLASAVPDTNNQYTPYGGYAYMRGWYVDGLFPNRYGASGTGSCVMY